MRAAPLRRRLAWLLLLLGPALAPSASRAEDAEPDERMRTLATDLFDQGVRKMELGKCEVVPVVEAAVCAEAADAFRRAFDLYPAALGALRNLAYVEKALGRVASAARHFRELARRAPLDPRPERQLWAEFARTELVDLEARVPHLQLTMPVTAPAGTAVTLDGAPLPREAWGAAIDLDPGEHLVQVQALGQKPFVARFTLPERTTETVTVTLAPEVAPASPPPPPRTREASSTPSPRTLALVTMGVGIVTTGVGLGYGVAAIEKRQEVCGAQYCDRAGYDEGRSLARNSTILTGIGLAVAGGGVVWYLLAPSREARTTIVTPYAGVGGAGVVVVRRF